MNFICNLKSTFTGLARITSLGTVIVVGLVFLIVGNTYAAVTSRDDVRKKCADGQIDLCASLGVVFERQGKMEESKEFYKKACDLSPWRDRVWGCEGLGALLEKEGRIEEARPLFRKPCDHGQLWDCYKWALFEKRQKNTSKFEDLVVMTCNKTEYIRSRAVPLLNSCSDAFNHFLGKRQYEEAKKYVDKICSVAATSPKIPYEQQTYDLRCNKLREKYREVSAPIMEYRVFKQGDGVYFDANTPRKNHYVITEDRAIKLGGNRTIDRKVTHTVVSYEVAEYGPFVIASDLDLRFGFDEVEKSTISYDPTTKEYSYRNSDGKRTLVVGRGSFSGHPPNVNFIRSIDVEGSQRRYLLVRWAEDSRCEFGCCQFTYALIAIEATPRFMLWDQHGCDV